MKDFVVFNLIYFERQCSTISRVLLLAPLPSICATMGKFCNLSAMDWIVSPIPQICMLRPSPSHVIVFGDLDFVRELSIDEVVRVGFHGRIRYKKRH